MDERIARALARGHLIDITTTGRKSGRARRIEVVFHNFDGHLYISGRPGRRGWYANLLSHPDFTFHLKGPVTADLRATARAITDQDERRRVLGQVATAWRMPNTEVLVQRSPLVEVTIRDAPVPAREPAARAS